MWSELSKTTFKRFKSGPAPVATQCCWHCGAPVAPNAAYCSSCGTALAVPRPNQCPRCGSTVIPKSTFCASCGAPLAVPSAPPSAPGTAPSVSFPSVASPYPPSYTSYAPVGFTTAASQEADRTALSKIATAAILGVIGFALSFAVALATPALSLLVRFSSGTSANTSAIVLVVGALLASVALTFMELWLFRGAFAALSSFDPRFTSPRQLTLVAIVGLALVLAGVIALFAVIAQVSSTACGAPPPAACSNSGIPLGSVLAILAVLLVGAITALIGIIGLAIGVWRLGTRYSEGLFKAGAVLLIVFNLVGLILILIAVRSTRKGFFETGSPPASFG